MEKESKKTYQKVYDFIVDFIKENGYPPSIREIGARTYLSSTSSVYNHLLTLERMGKISMKENTPRSIRVVGYSFMKTEESALWEEADQL